ncbi:MAG: hypothetical protein RIF41_40875 [Polyangiaceae bacterium]
MSVVRVVWLAPVLVACGGDAAPPRDPTPHPLAACAEVLSSPTTVLDVVGVIDALPEPTIPCFVASLERPLSVVVSRSQFSAQPAVDVDDPRIFLMRPGLTITIVTAGFGRELLELGEWESPTRTLKAELEFPLTPPVPDEAPFEQVLNTSSTVTGIESGCSVCHAEEQLALELDGVNGYSSVALRPLDELVLPLSTLESSRQACADVDRGVRCDMLRAVVDFGVEEGSFDTAVATFTD